MIAHILLLPHPEHRERLLAPGVLVRAPNGRFGWTVDIDGETWVVYEDGDGRLSGAHHLVLARDGAVCPEGSDRLSRVANLDRHTVDIIVGARLRGRRNDGEGEIARFGTLVLLDADGREVSGG